MALARTARPSPSHKLLPPRPTHGNFSIERRPPTTAVKLGFAPAAARGLVCVWNACELPALCACTAQRHQATNPARLCSTRQHLALDSLVQRGIAARAVVHARVLVLVVLPCIVQEEHASHVGGFVR